MSLLENALKIERKRKNGREVSQEERELALAWADGKVSISQVAAVLGVKSGGVYPFLANVLRIERLKGF